jgi:hypothetical protein
MNSFRLTMRWIVLAAVLVPMGCGPVYGYRTLERFSIQRHTAVGLLGRVPEQRAVHSCDGVDQRNGSVGAE